MYFFLVQFVKKLNQYIVLGLKEIVKLAISHIVRNVGKIVKRYDYRTQFVSTQLQ